MPVTNGIAESNANANNFQIIKTPLGKFTIDAKVNSIVGSPTWSLMVSNIGDIEANFKYYSPETTNMAIDTAVESDQLAYAYIAIKYTANAATGTYLFNIGIL